MKGWGPGVLPQVPASNLMARENLRNIKSVRRAWYKVTVPMVLTDSRSRLLGVEGEGGAVPLPFNIYK